MPPVGIQPTPPTITAGMRRNTPSELLVAMGRDRTFRLLTRNEGIFLFILHCHSFLPSSPLFIGGENISQKNYGPEILVRLKSIFSYQAVQGHTRVKLQPGQTPNATSLFRKSRAQKTKSQTLETDLQSDGLVPQNFLPTPRRMDSKGETQST